MPAVFLWFRAGFWVLVFGVVFFWFVPIICVGGGFCAFSHVFILFIFSDFLTF